MGSVSVGRYTPRKPHPKDLTFWEFNLGLTPLGGYPQRYCRWHLSFVDEPFTAIAYLTSNLTSIFTTPVDPESDP